MKYDPNLVVPVEVIKAVQTVTSFAATRAPGDDWQIGGLGPVFALQRQLAEVTRERDTLKAMLDLQNLRAERANLGSGK